VQDEQSIDEVVVSMEGGPYQEYFYIEIPVSAGTPSITSSSSGEGAGEGGDGAVVEGGAGRVEKPRHRRFVYVQEEGVRKFPMQFGLEVSSAVHVALLLLWKHNVYWLAGSSSRCWYCAYH
jgi:hypothetical protein